MSIFHDFPLEFNQVVIERVKIFTHILLSAVRGSFKLPWWVRAEPGRQTGFRCTWKMCNRLVDFPWFSTP